MACLQRASPALREMLLKFYRSEKPMETDHTIYEFGSVRYHLQASASEAQELYLSIITPLLLPETQSDVDLPYSTLETVRRTYCHVAEVIVPPKEGFQLTLRLDFTKFPPRKGDCSKVINEISSLQAVILGSRMKHILGDLGSQVPPEAMHRPIKLFYHPREPFFVVRMPDKITAIFPMRFKDDSDVVLGTAFFQELMDVGCSKTFARAPSCTWAPIPPPELRGEPFQDLSTNGGFVSFDILPRHVQGAKLNKTVWCLLNFPTYVKYHVKCTRGFIQGRMRRRLEALAQVIQKPETEGDSVEFRSRGRLNAGRRYVQKLKTISKPKILTRNCIAFRKQLRRLRPPIKIQGFSRFRTRWLAIPGFRPLKKYQKLE